MLRLQTQPRRHKPMLHAHARAVSGFLGRGTAATQHIKPKQLIFRHNTLAWLSLCRGADNSPHE
jgi:hypothetical protein